MKFSTISKHKSKKCNPYCSPLWSMNLQHEEFDGNTDSPLYQVFQDGHKFSVMYFGSCEIQRCNSLEEAKTYCRNNVLKYGRGN